MGYLRPLPLPLLPPWTPTLPPLSPLWPDGPPYPGFWIYTWGGGVMCCPLLPPSPFSAFSLHRPSFLFRPVPWTLGIESVIEEPGFGHYVGRPPACCELSGPRWPGPALREFPSPLMGEMRPLCLLSRPGLPLRYPPLRFVLRWGRGIHSSWVFPPISWFRPRTKGVRACSGGGPPL